ncbi:hypothetical protein BYT27DRAFT_7201854 [Phlegmacium glaucopus]|nr:hypothetical protein BYT27DRAFT_7201854 [Phlegmacium glaucopus]
MLMIQAMDSWYQNAYGARKRQDSIRLALMSASRGQLPMSSESSIIWTLLVAGVLQPILQIVNLLYCPSHL